MNLEEFLTLATKEEASDLFIVAGLPLTMKVNGVMRRINEEKMMPQDTEKIIREIYEKALDRDIDQLLKTGDDDFSFAIPGLSRFRVSAYKQRGSLAAVIRVIAFRLPDYKQLRIPEQVMKLIAAVSSANVDEFEYNNEEFSIRIAKKKAKIATVDASVAGVPVQSAAIMPEQNEEQPEEILYGDEIKAPLVGTFYVAPSEGAEPFVSVGDKVKKGQVIGIVEAMKLMNEVESEYDGTVAAILVENGEMVEYGQPLMVIQ